MPWNIRQRSGKYCVFKEGEDSPITCHDTRREATAHLRALYAHEPKGLAEVEVKEIRAHAELKEDASEGSVKAVFSTFDVVDSDGDVVLASAFKDGQAVPMVWAHDWTKICGKGAIRVEGNRAVFDGQFFTDTTIGMDAYRTVKAMGDLQEYSWGFRVPQGGSEYGEKDGQRVRFIKQADVYEVSPVLVGANRQTGTLALKEQKQFSIEPLEGSYEDIIEDIEDALRETLGGPFGMMGYACVVATFPDYCIACVYEDGEQTYYRIPYTLNADGDPVLGAPSEVQPTFVPATGQDMTMASHADRTLAVLKAFEVRVKALAALRAKEGRVLSERNRNRLVAHVDTLRTVAGELEGMVQSATPAVVATMETPVKGANAPPLAPLFLEWQKLEAALNGAASLME